MITNAVDGLDDNSTEEQIMAALETDPQAMAQVRVAEIEAETAAGQANVTNTQGAREMHASMKDLTTPLLTLAVVIGFFGVCYAILYTTVSEGNKELLYLIVGYIAGDFKTVLNFYFWIQQGEPQ